MRLHDLRHFVVDRAGLLDQENNDLREPFLDPDDHGTLRPPVPMTDRQMAMAMVEEKLLD